MYNKFCMILCVLFSTQVSLAFSLKSEIKNAIIESVNNPYDCSFYSPYLEHVKPCGKDGYALSLGYKYCLKVQDLYEHHNDEIVVILKNINTCLKRKMLPVIENPNGYTCSDVKYLANTSHDECYIESGYCDLLYNPFKVVSSYHFISIFVNYLEFEDIDMFYSNIYTFNKKCAKRQAYKLRDKLFDWF